MDILTTQIPDLGGSQLGLFGLLSVTAYRVAPYVAQGVSRLYTDTVGWLGKRATSRDEERQQYLSTLKEMQESIHQMTASMVELTREVRGDRELRKIEHESQMHTISDLAHEVRLVGDITKKCATN